ncbi:MAG: LysR family transcriptional regulator [Clostridia bacterium]|nr:LysR family transcriptional regulator [Clostridia bacterium]
MKEIEKYVYEVYNTKSFSIAASKLFISQPALSNAVKRHEKQLGYDIFDRKSHPLSVTRKGMIYIEYLEEKLELARQLKENINRLDYEIDKKIRIGSNNSSAVFTLPALCKEFGNHFPEVNIEITMAESTNKLYENVEKELIDIVLDSKNSFSTFEKLKLWEEKYVFLIRKDYPGVEKLQNNALSYEELCSGIFPEKKKIKDWSPLKNINIFMPLKNAYMSDLINNYFKDILAKKIVIKKFYRTDLQFGMVKSGLGAMICPQSLVLNKEYDENKYCCFNVDIPDNLREVYLYYNKNNTSEYVNKFLKTAEEMFIKKHFFAES